MSATAVEGEWANQCINAKLTYLQYITLICKLGEKGPGVNNWQNSADPIIIIYVNVKQALYWSIII